MKHIYIYLFILSIFLVSCEQKNITGTIMDNLGNPIENVSITISNTEFKTTSNRDGEFSLDYVPGELDIKIEKNGYVKYEQHYVISEKSNYPVGKVELVKIPQNKGVFCAFSGDYLKVPKVMMNSTEKEKLNRYKDKYLDINYFINKDSLFDIKCPEGLKIKFIDNTGLALRLVKIDSITHRAAKYQITMFSTKVITKNGIEEIHELTDVMKERIVNVEKGGIYAFLNINDNTFSQKMSDIAFTFIVK